MNTLRETLRLTLTPAPTRSVHARAAAIPLFVVLTAVGAYLAFPLPGTPVPVTLQTLFVLVSGAILGPWLGATAMATYLALGAAGLPVFAGGGAGLAWLLGPTGGYLVAFPAAAFVTGWVAEGGRGWLRLAGAFVLGTVVILSGGATQLALLTASPIAEAAALGVLPFLPGAVVKTALGVMLVRLSGRDRADT